METSSTTLLLTSISHNNTKDVMRFMQFTALTMNLVLNISFCTDYFIIHNVWFAKYTAYLPHNYSIIWWSFCSSICYNSMDLYNSHDTAAFSVQYWSWLRRPSWTLTSLSLTGAKNSSISIRVTMLEWELVVLDYKKKLELIIVGTSRNNRLCWQL